MPVRMGDLTYGCSASVREGGSLHRLEHVCACRIPTGLNGTRAAASTSARLTPRRTETMHTLQSSHHTQVKPLVDGLISRAVALTAPYCPNIGRYKLQILAISGSSCFRGYEWTADRVCKVNGVLDLRGGNCDWSVRMLAYCTQRNEQEDTLQYR